MRVQRSLTIKQMANVSAVAIVVICIFISVQLFHFVQQRRIEYAQQMENIAHTIRQPLSEAVLKADIPAAQQLLNTLKPAGVLGHADIRLPDQLDALQIDFTHNQPDKVPALIARIFQLPVRITVPLYSTEQSGLPKPLAWLVLEADSVRVYQFILSTLSTMVITSLLLALVLSVSVSWFINRLMIHPLRNICRDLQDNPGRQLMMPENHHDDEIGVLVRSVNQNQAIADSAHEEVERLNTHFRFTGLPNRTLFLALLEQYLRQKGQGQSVGLMVLRIAVLPDILSPKNKELLQRLLADKLRRTLGLGSQLAQLSATDFVMFYEHGVQPLLLMRQAQLVMDELTQPLALQDMPLRPVVSIGLASQHSENLNAADFLEHGISAMMSATRENGNQIMFFDPQMTERAKVRLAQFHDILQGIHEKEYALYLQPQVDMNSGKLVGAEALLRIRRDDGKYSLPEDFITTAEDIGVMPEIGRWVFEEACRILANWQAHGIMLPLSVNTSALQLQDPMMVSHLQNLLSDLKINPGSFVLELTETAKIDDTERAMELLRPIEKTGVSVVLDDFGMGYSNLHYLHQFRSLPVRRLKLDRSFVAGLPADDTMVRIVGSIADIMQLDVIAEGVETTEQRDWLLARGIHIAQGYLYSPALSEQVFNEQWLVAPISEV
ncbi:biofilm formation regulator HmsP [Tatumella sp. UBA2305]|uniref:biofilm formation regulator HmsP n=1 Tax=Tatumella sp. UBA2305 TaxID=1947647 RepID=UPI0025F477C0|nr:biofilm formation regulator HmsP [Tatumella sp. UBA2305]